MSQNNGASGQRSARTGLDTRWPRVAMAIAGTWSLLYLALGIAWLMGGPGNPADPAVDDEGATLSLLGSLGPGAGALIVTMLAALGVLLAGAMRVLRSATGRFGFVQWLVSVLAGSLGVILAVVLPDYRLLATLAYTPLLLVLKVGVSGTPFLVRTTTSPHGCRRCSGRCGALHLPRPPMPTGSVDAAATGLRSRQEAFPAESVRAPEDQDQDSEDQHDGDDQQVIAEQFVQADRGGHRRPPRCPE